MTAYSTADLDRIRTLLGYGFQIDYEPRIESAILSTQAVADGGSQPDTNLQQAIYGILNNVSAVEAQLLILVNMMYADTSASGSKVKVRSAMRELRKQGRMYIQQLVIKLGLQAVRQDYFSAPDISDDPTGRSAAYSHLWEF